MKIMLNVLATLAVMSLAVQASLKNGEHPGDKEITIIGDARCAKCDLRESGHCQGVVEVTEQQNKKVHYYLDDNAVTRDFHKNISKGELKVVAIGTNSRTEGRNQFTATKIEMTR